MCGIIGYIGKEKKAINVIINGLKSLEYRGYDSAGIAVLEDNKIKIVKSSGKIKNLEIEIKNLKESNIGIGHTRWATHGEPSFKNAHPHKNGNITLVHNGIIENYEEIKKELLKDGYNFISDTDSEIACAYIDKIYKETKDKLETIKLVQEKIRGSYAFGIIFDDELDTIYATRKDSPLIVATNKNENFIASDVPAILNETNKYILLDQQDIAVIKEDSIKIYDKNLNEKKYEIKEFEDSKEAALKNGFEHYMLKEIYDEPTLVKEFINLYLKDEKTLLTKIPDITKYKKIEIVACGSAYHAGLVGKNLLEEYANIETHCYVASEYRYSKHFFDKETLVILISQSGETADTLAALRLAKENNIDTLGIINVVGSSIAREVDNVIYLNAGYEIAVATTKAYLMQVLVLSLLAFATSIKKDLLDKELIKKIIKDYKGLDKILEEVINNRETYYNIAKEIYNKKNVFFIGRKIDASLCMEASLKLKEISYMHSEAYEAGELKHGTISLIENNTEVISIITDKSIAEKTISNIKETIARGADVTLLTTDKIMKEYKSSNFYNNKIVVPNQTVFTEPLIISPTFQLLSYEIAKLRGEDIDQPRNLAKSVTVE